MKLSLLLLCASGFAVAQPIGAGIKVGLPLTDFINTVNGQTTSTTNRYIVGPMVELRLPAGFGIEFNALYRHFDVTSAATSLAQAATGSASAWEFPLVAKYKFHSHIIRPYVEAGVAWNHVGKITTNVVLEPKATVTGVVLGGGLDIHAIVIHISPELRYTRWTSQNFNVSGVLHSNQDQAEFLVGITF